jgi:hypothetical protein
MKKMVYSIAILENIRAFWYMLWPLCNLVANWYIFHRFGTLNKENLATLIEAISSKDILKLASGSISDYPTQHSEISSSQSNGHNTDSNLPTYVGICIPNLF